MSKQLLQVWKRLPPPSFVNPRHQVDSSHRCPVPGPHHWLSPVLEPSLAAAGEGWSWRRVEGRWGLGVGWAVRIEMAGQEGDQGLRERGWRGRVRAAGAGALRAAGGGPGQTRRLPPSNHSPHYMEN